MASLFILIRLNFFLIQALYYEYGERRAEYERIPILHYYECDDVARQETHDIWARSFGAGDGARD